jgi:hypothetical protein
MGHPEATTFRGHLEAIVFRYLKETKRKEIPKKKKNVFYKN